MLVLWPQKEIQPGYELPLYAATSDRGDTIAAATAKIDENLEGLFILDYKSGRLTLDVVNYLDARKPGGHFVRGNVHADLKLESEKPAYLMLTAETQFGGGRVRDTEPARSVVYIIDQHTGRWAAYGLLWSPGRAKAGTFQQGELLPLQIGTARPEEVQ
jgi:hypothetical protein